MSLSNIIGKLDTVEALELTTRALDLIGSIAKGSIANTAMDAVKLIHNIYNAVVDSAAEKITPADAHKALDALEHAIQLNDAAADAEIAKKFDDTDKK